MTESGVLGESDSGIALSENGYGESRRLASGLVPTRDQLALQAASVQCNHYCKKKHEDMSGNVVVSCHNNGRRLD
jgi:hypothetical protein